MPFEGQFSVAHRRPNIPLPEIVLDDPRRHSGKQIISRSLLPSLSERFHDVFHLYFSHVIGEHLNFQPSVPALYSDGCSGTRYMNRIIIFVASLLATVITGCTRNSDLVEAKVTAVVPTGAEEAPWLLVLDYTKPGSIGVSGITCSNEWTAESVLGEKLRGKKIAFPHPGHLASPPVVSADEIHLMENPNITVAKLLLAENGCQVAK